MDTTRYVGRLAEPMLGHGRNALRCGDQFACQHSACVACPQARLRGSGRVKAGAHFRPVARDGSRALSRQSVASAASTLEALDGDVRSEVRRRGVDPLTDVDAVRRFARTAVLAHDQLSLSGVVRPVQDAELMVDELVARVAGFGPLQRYLDDPAVEEVWINQPQRVFVARAGKHELTTTILDAVEVRDLVERMLKTSGRRLDLSTPFVDAMLPSGHRLHVVLDGITRGFSAVNIRKFVVRAKRLHDLVELGTLTTQAAAFLDACVVAGLNIIVAGGTQAGKTTMLNTLGSAVPGGERIVSTEEVFELPNACRLQTCERLYISVKAWTVRAPAQPSTVSARTASSCALRGAGTLLACSATTTRRHRPANRALHTSRCSGVSIKATLRS